MYCLKVPDTFTRLGIEREQRVGEEIVAESRDPIKIGCRGASGSIDNAALRINRHAGPVVGRALSLPCVPGPGIVAKLSGIRNGVERPAQRARPHVVGANVARRRRQRLRIAAANNQQIFINGSRAGESPGLKLRVASQILAQIYSSVLSEARYHLAGGWIEGIDKIHHAHEEPFFMAFAPIRNPAIRLAPIDLGVEGPQQLPGGCVQSYRLQLGGKRVKNSVYDDRRGLHSARFAGIELPRHMELCHVGAVDLLQAGVMCIFRSAANDGPVGGVFLRPILPRTSDAESERANQNERGKPRLINLLQGSHPGLPLSCELNMVSAFQIEPHQAYMLNGLLLELRVALQIGLMSF